MQTAVQSHSRRSKTFMKTLSLIFLNLFLLNTSSAQTENVFQPIVPDWTYISDTDDALLSHPHESFQGVLTKNTTEFAPSMLVFKLQTDTLLEKKLSFKKWLESELFENRLTFLRKENTESMKTYVYKGVGESIVYAYIFWTPNYFVIMTQDTNLDMQHSDFRATKYDLEKVKFVGLF